MSESDNLLSDDAKWFIRTFAVFGTLIFIIWRLGIKIKVMRDGVNVNDKRFSNGRMKIRHTDHYNEFELIELDKNAWRAREAMQVVDGGPYECPWDDECPFQHPVDGNSLEPLKYLVSLKKGSDYESDKAKTGTDANEKEQAINLMVNLGEHKEYATSHFDYKMREYHVKAAYEYTKHRINEKRDKRLSHKGYPLPAPNAPKGEWLRPDVDREWLRPDVDLLIF